MADPETDAFSEMEAFAAEEAGEAPETPAEPDPVPEPPEEPEQLDADPEPADADSEDDEAAARALGWRPLDEWKGKPEDHQDPATFLERARHTYSTVRKMERQLEEQQKRNEERFRKFGELAEQQRARAVAEAEARMKQAREDLDFEAYDAAQKDRAALDQKQETPPEDDRKATMVSEVKAYREANDWAKSDFVWAKVADEVGPLIQRRIDAGQALSVADQMKMAEDAARVMFPAAFTDPPRKPTASAVDNGGLRQPGKKRDTGWDDLAPEDRSFLEGMIRSGDFKDRADAMKSYKTTFGG